MHKSHVRSLSLVAATVFVVSCRGSSAILEDAAVLLEDAAGIVDGDARAQMEPRDPIQVVCADNFELVSTYNSGMANERTVTREYSVAQVDVANPARWLVEMCDAVVVQNGEETTFGSCGAAGVDCTGSAPPVPRCTLNAPSYTGNIVIIYCSTALSTEAGSVTSSTTTTYGSVRLVPNDQ